MSLSVFNLKPSRLSPATRQLLAIITLALLPACKSITTTDRTSLCLAGSEAASAACGAASISGTITAPESTEAPAQKAVPPLATPTSLHAQTATLQSQTQTTGRDPLVLPPFLRNGADITAAIPAKPVFDTTRIDGKIEGQRRRSVSLHEAVSVAAFAHPEIKAAEAKVREAKAGIDMSRAALFPQGDTRLAVGGSQGGNAVGRSIYERANPDGNARVDASISFKQLLFDFGATRADIDRASYVRDAEKLRLLDKVDDIVHKTAQAYLKILEARALLSLVDETVVAHRKLAGIVQANQREGNGTAADVNRVNARLTDMNAIRADVSLQLAGAEEAFHRLTRIHPGELRSAPSLSRDLPPSAEAAIAFMRRNNPRLSALNAMSMSLGKEIEFQRANSMPKFQLESDADTKNYAALNRNKNESEARALVTMRYKFMDGGLSHATSEQLHHRRDGNQQLMRNEDEQTSADIRQAYRAVNSARTKGRLVAEGVQTSAKVQELYLEQFKAGRRTVFELLDSQMSSFTVRRSAIESRYEGERATFDILRNSGKLAEALSRAPLAGSPDARTAMPVRRAGSRSAAAPAKVGEGRKGSLSMSGAQPETYPVNPARMPKRIPEAALKAAPSETPKP